jgi:accessory gene regulator B
MEGFPIKMMMRTLTITLSEKLAHWTRRQNPDEPRDFENLRYQYAVTINFVSIVCLSLIGGLITGRLADTMTAAAAFMVLRAFSGGFHFRSLDVCTVVTAVIFIAIPFVPADSFMYVLNAFSAALVALLAPTNLKNTFWTGNDTVKRVFKAIAVTIVLTNFYVMSPVIAVAFTVQALLLIPIPRKEVRPL